MTERIPMEEIECIFYRSRLMDSKVYECRIGWRCKEQSGSWLYLLKHVSLELVNGLKIQFWSNVNEEVIQQTNLYL